MIMIADEDDDDDEEEYEDGQQHRYNARQLHHHHHDNAVDDKDGEGGCDKLEVLSSECEFRIRILLSLRATMFYLDV